MSIADTPSFCTVDLIKTVNENCKTAENIAVQTVISRDIPVLNVFRELTKGDCWKILRKQETFGSVEQAIVLSMLTDYIACAYQNELFEIFCKKQEEASFTALLSYLNGKWIRYFHKSRHNGLSYAQLNSTVSLLRQSLKKLPEKYYMIYMRDSLMFGERALLQSQKHTIEFGESRDKLDIRVGENNNHHDPPVKTKVEHGKLPTSGIKPLQEKKPNANKVTKSVSGNTKRTKSQKKASDCNNPVVIGITSQPPVKMQRRKYNADITRYISKSLEDKNIESVTTNDSISGTESKENWIEEDKSLNAMELDVKLKDPVVEVTPETKLNLVVSTGSPSKKKSLTEDKSAINRVNAFEMMMKQSRVVKGKTVKRKSLFN